jgi:shikimate kinase
MKAIFLTGFMGSGKTTVGERLAEKTNLDLVDTDHYIEKKEGKTIREIFSEDGEAAFRQCEKVYLKELPQKNIIITTGGGIVIQKENREWMKATGFVIYLHCEPKEILDRLRNDDTRPLLDKNKQNSIIQLFNDRLPLYEEADAKVDTTNKTIDNIVDEIIIVLDRINID